MEAVKSLITPETNPDHETVGHYFKGLGGLIYFCESYDPSCGFWMAAVGFHDKRTNVSERAIGRTYHKVHVTTRAVDP